jgi:glycosyltransferase involved in cell wall biosynthesis
LLVPPKDPPALAHCLAVLKRDPQLAERMGAAGLERAKQMFTWHGVARSLTSVYARVAGIATTEHAGGFEERARIAAGGASA